MKIKLISGVLLLALSLSALCLPAFAAEQTPDKVYEETYSQTLPATVSVPTDSKATPTFSVKDGALLVDNTDGTAEATLQLVNGLPNNAKDYYVEATITLLSLKDAVENDSRYIALGANFKDSEHYVSATVRYNGTINFEQRAGTTTYNKIAESSKTNISAMTPAETVVLNKAYTLKIHFHDSTADLYVNGQKMMEGVNAVSGANGAIGLMLKKGVKASVDNVSYVVNEYGAAKIIPTRVASENFSMVVFDEIKNPNSNPYGAWMAGQNTKYYLSDMENESLCTAGRTAYKDTKYKGTEAAGITLAMTHTFDKGLGVHPSGDWNEDNDLGGGCYATIDIWQYTNPQGQYACDTFYSAVGLTDASSAGVWFVVFGDKEDGNGFVQLACSSMIEKYNYGEFNVDVTGVHTLKLVVCADTKYNSSASGWAGASIFKKDATAVKPDYTVEVDTSEDEDEVVTKAPVSKETDVAKTPKTNETKEAESTEKGGCSSSVSVSVFSVMTMLMIGASAIVRKKEQ